MSGSIMVGIITRSNLKHAMVSMARVAPDVVKSKDDAGIRQEKCLQRGILGLHHPRRLASNCSTKEQGATAPVALTRVAVHDGWSNSGGLVDERQREALKVVAENIPGVKTVKDQGLGRV